MVNGTLDYETQAEYTLELRAYNKEAEPSTIPGTESIFIVPIKLIDVNEPPIWQENDIIFQENVLYGE